MAETRIDERTVRTLTEFYALMEETAIVRRRLVVDRLADRPPRPDDVASLERAHASLDTIEGRGHERRLLVGEHTPVDVDLTYEFVELEKDLAYLDLGEAAFLDHLARLHDVFDEPVGAIVDRLDGIALSCFLTDRDGTINNYCGRYRSSIQSAYNAVFLARFARRCCGTPIIITSAPLAHPGIVDVSVTPEGTLVLAASKGREFVDLEGRRHRQPIADEDQALLDRLDRRLEALVDRPANRRFGLIGSGLQQKFGQTTVARQDIAGSIDPAESEAFLEQVEQLVRELDPAGDRLVVEDTGLDVEVILTIGDGGDVRDFGKRDAVGLLERELGLDLAVGPHLVCGDTASDVPMVEGVRERTSATHTVFVTEDDELADRVGIASPGAIVVPEPDHLVSALALLSR
jgi:hypothetical protein